MGRPRRYYESGRLYEITFRVREGLPFPAWESINLILLSAMARAQRYEYVTICHFLWMANHVHILVVVRDAEACKRFYTEIKKKLTDSVKRLLGVDHLQLWDGRASVVPVLDLEAAIERVRYLYCNPARAELVKDIAEYPGLSSWRAYKEVSAAIDAEHVQSVPWIQQFMISPLRAPTIKKKDDWRLADSMRAQARVSHQFTVRPNAWMKCFGVLTSQQVIEVNRKIFDAINDSQNDIAQGLAQRGRRPIGAEMLRQERIMKPHNPKPKDGHIYALSKDPGLRSDFVEKLKRISDECARLGELQRLGLRVTWPPGVFPAPLPLIANALAA